MRKILCLAAATLGCGAVAMADDSAAAIRDFGLFGTWASYCSASYSPQQPGFRIVFAEQPGEAPTYTTISMEGSVSTTVRSTVLEALPDGIGRLRLRVRIIGGDRGGGGPLPNPTTNTFEQVIEKVEGQGIRLAGLDPRFIQKCSD
jgi:hypothetical protein